MNVTVPSKLPMSTLPPAALLYKFQQAGFPQIPAMPKRFVPGFAGLGYQSCTPDEVGGETCVDIPDGAGGGGTTLDCNVLAPGTPGCPVSDWGDLFGVPVATDPSGGTITTWNPPFIDSSGNVILASSSGGGYTSVSPGGTRTVYTGAPPSAGTGTITTQQAAAYASLIAALSNAGVHLLAASNLPAGATILPNGTILGTGQTIGPGGVNQNPLSTILTNPTVLLLAFATVIVLAELK